MDADSSDYGSRYQDGAYQDRKGYAFKYLYLPRTGHVKVVAFLSSW